MILMVEVAVGFMLKVLKTNQKLTEFKDEFNAIKHGDYKTFLSLIDGEIPLMVIYNGGGIRAEENNPKYLGISVFSIWTHKSVFELCQRIKNKHPDIEIVLGGKGINVIPHLSIRSKLSKLEHLEIPYKYKIVDQAK